MNQKSARENPSDRRLFQLKRVKFSFLIVGQQIFILKPLYFQRSGAHTISILTGRLSRNIKSWKEIPRVADQKEETERKNKT